MDFYGNLRSQLLRQLNADTHRVAAVGNEPDISDVDLSYFADLVKQERIASFAFHEQVRVKHTLFKTAIDGVQ
ncbi:hypothetical protein [Pseudomonas yamanorum]|jgi:hypothetical protein|uniref:hypothetical protein n=1 Tax=Pseudomonas yamanorum TaxID=515393 RepID=UPI0015A26AA1|nr:hypothetical protein [Pseudomonas yamanorum]NWD25896.1 hypothetical protein [Pseudomonas yamanorum]